jgi:hypothetical protein
MTISSSTHTTLASHRREQDVSLRFHSQLGRAASKRCNVNRRSPAVYEDSPDSLLISKSFTL